MSDYTSLGHPISPEPQRLPRCCICNAPVLLETSKTDEYGQALHEECYVLKLSVKEEWVVLKLWLKADFLNTGRTSAKPRQTGTRSATLAKRVSWHKWPWNLELAAVATVLLLTCWVVYGDGHPASFLGSLGLQRSNALEAQVIVPTKAVVTKGRSKPLTLPVSVEEADAANFLEQVGDGENEVVHIGDDVTVRYFTKPARTDSGSGREVSSRSIGEDVTVRYFSPIDRSTRD
jgi:hypothetical protein